MEGWFNHVKKIEEIVGEKKHGRSLNKVGEEPHWLGLMVEGLTLIGG